MSAVRFAIEMTFDLPGRDGILASGTVQSGVIRAGMALRTETNLSVRVLAVEFGDRGTRRRRTGRRW